MTLFCGMWVLLCGQIIEPRSTNCEVVLGQSHEYCAQVDYDEIKYVVRRAIPKINRRMTTAEVVQGVCVEETRPRDAELVVPVQAYHDKYSRYVERRSIYDFESIPISGRENVTHCVIGCGNCVSYTCFAKDFVESPRIPAVINRLFHEQYVRLDGQINLRPQAVSFVDKGVKCQTEDKAISTVADVTEYDWVEDTVTIRVPRISVKVTSHSLVVSKCCVTCEMPIARCKCPSQAGAHHSAP